MVKILVYIDVYYTLPDTPRHHPATQKHAETAALDAYLWFKKNLAKKFVLGNFLGQFEVSKKIIVFFFQRNAEI